MEREREKGRWVCLLNTTEIVETYIHLYVCFFEYIWCLVTSIEYLSFDFY